MLSSLKYNKDTKWLRERERGDVKKFVVIMTGTICLIIFNILCLIFPGWANFEPSMNLIWERG